MRNLRLIDVLVITLMAAAVSVMAAIKLRHSSHARDRTECYYNLRELYNSYYVFIYEHGHPLTQVSTNDGGTKEYVGHNEMAYMHFRALLSKNVANGGVVVDRLCCPKDARQPAAFSDIVNKNISYFLSQNTPNETNEWVVMGNRNLKFTLMAGDTSGGKWEWSPNEGLHGERGFLVLLNGEIRESRDNEVNRLFHQPGNATNSLVFP